MSGKPQTHTRMLTSILIEAGVVTQGQVDAGLVQQRTTGHRIGETLVEMGAATEEDIGWALARQLDLPFVDPRPEALDRDMVRTFPDGMLRRLDAVPLLLDDKELSVAVADPLDIQSVEELERVSGRLARLSVSTPSAIRRVLREVLGDSGGRPGARSEQDAPASAATSGAQLVRAGTTFLNAQLEAAFKERATEIHILPSGGSLAIYYRAAGRLTRVSPVDSEALDGLLARIGSLGGPALGSRVDHAAGVVEYGVGPDTISLGVSLLRTAGGIAATLELRPTTSLASGLGALGLDPVDLARLREALAAPYGLGLVAGPPRSGGSTTLACMLLDSARDDRRALAFGPVASFLPAELRVATDDDAARFWTEVAASQCADVVALDGVLDGETITAALAPAGAGRLVLARTDWTDSFALLEHLAARPWGRAALAERLAFVIQERLLVARADAPPGDPAIPPGGRRAVFELLIADDPLREAIRAGASAERLRACAQSTGLRTLATRVRTLREAGVVDAVEAERALA